VSASTMTARGRETMGRGREVNRWRRQGGVVRVRRSRREGDGGWCSSANAVPNTAVAPATWCDQIKPTGWMCIAPGPTVANWTTHPLLPYHWDGSGGDGFPTSSPTVGDDVDTVRRPIAVQTPFILRYPRLELLATFVNSHK
jgi:hypothetical protein